MEQYNYFNQIITQPAHGKTAWAKEETTRLEIIVINSKDSRGYIKWNEVVPQMPGRTLKQCKCAYQQKILPTMTGDYIKGHKQWELKDIELIAIGLMMNFSSKQIQEKYFPTLSALMVCWQMQNVRRLWKPRFEKLVTAIINHNFTLLGNKKLIVGYAREVYDYLLPVLEQVRLGNPLEPMREKLLYKLFENYDNLETFMQNLQIYLFEQEGIDKKKAKQMILKNLSSQYTLDCFKTQ